MPSTAGKVEEISGREVFRPIIRFVVKRSSGTKFGGKGGYR
jgi:hypothetical protein